MLTEQVNFATWDEPNIYAMVRPSLGIHAHHLDAGHLRLLRLSPLLARRKGRG